MQSTGTHGLVAATHVVEPATSYSGPTTWTGPSIGYLLGNSLDLRISLISGPLTSINISSLVYCSFAFHINPLVILYYIYNTFEETLFSRLFWLLIMCSLCSSTWLGFLIKSRLLMTYDLVRRSRKWSGSFLIFLDFFSLIHFPRSPLVIFLSTALFCCISSIYTLRVTTSLPLDPPVLAMLWLICRLGPKLMLRFKSSNIGSCQSSSAISSFAIFFNPLESAYCSQVPGK